MRIVWNILAVIGLLAVIALVGGLIRYGHYIDDVRRLDPQADAIYADMAHRLLETGSAVRATVRRVKVDGGLSVDDVEQVMESVATEHNIANVGELPLSKQLERMTGDPYRFVKIYMYCNPLSARQMLDYDNAYSAYLPCRITLVEDKEGQLWLYTLNMDYMIHGGAPLPPELRAEAERVRRVIYDIMDRAASGRF